MAEIIIHNNGNVLIPMNIMFNTSAECSIMPLKVVREISTGAASNTGRK